MPVVRIGLHMRRYLNETQIDLTEFYQFFINESVTIKRIISMFHWNIETCFVNSDTGRLSDIQFLMLKPH